MKFNDILPVLKEDQSTQADFGKPKVANNRYSTPLVIFPTNTVDGANPPTKAQRRLPYPLDTSFDLFADSYLKLRNLYELLNTASKNEALAPGQRQKMATFRDQIVTAAKTVKHVGVLLDQEFGQ